MICNKVRRQPDLQYPRNYMMKYQNYYISIGYVIRMRIKNHMSYSFVAKATFISTIQSSLDKLYYLRQKLCSDS